MVEGKRYPVYGTQFHPEKNNFEWVKGVPIPHTDAAVKASQAFADFFVSEARKSTTVMPEAQLNRELIYNYNPVFTGGTGGYFVQTYMF